MSDTSITGTQLRGHDLILALPQYSINFKLKKLLEHGETRDGKSVQHASFGTGATPFPTGTVSQLATKLFIANNPQKILYSISFSDGTCAYWDIMKSPPEGPFSASIANTIISFEVGLARAEIAMVDLPADVKADVNKVTKTLAPGAFMIQRLFMDFQTAKLDKYDEATTVWPTDFHSSE